PHPPPAPLFPYTTLFRSGQLLLGLSDERDFGNRVYAVRVAGRVGVEVASEGEARGDAPLLHRDRRKTRKAYHVADGKDVRLLRRSEEHTSELQSLRHLVC